jgi:hypothetical protein
VVDLATNGVSQTIELDLEILSETGRVVVSEGLGVTKGLQQWVGLKDNVLDVSDLLRVTRDSGNVLHNQLGSLGLTGSGFTTIQENKGQIL